MLIKSATQFKWTLILICNIFSYSSDFDAICAKALQPRHPPSWFSYWLSSRCHRHSPALRHRHFPFASGTIGRWMLGGPLVCLPTYTGKAWGLPPPAVTCWICCPGKRTGLAQRVTWPWRNDPVIIWRWDAGAFMIRACSPNWSKSAMIASTFTKSLKSTECAGRLVFSTVDFFFAWSF